MSLEEAVELQKEIQSRLSTDEVSDAINAAARLMTGRRFEQCIEAYKAIAAKYPEQRGTCEGQIGAALFFLDRFEEAIVQYEAAKTHGEDADMMGDNIKEAREALAKKG